jgi:hypothetical protein
VNVGVTREASPAQHSLIRMQTGTQGLARLQVVRVQEIRMTLLAEERNRRDQKRVLVGAMRSMAIEAFLAHRRMLEQEGPALFRMTLVARLIDLIRFQQRACQGAVRIVAVVAAHLTFRQRHVRTPVELQSDILVTLRAGVIDR